MGKSKILGKRMSSERRRTFVLCIILIAVLEVFIMMNLYKRELETEKKDARVYGESVAASVQISLEMYISKAEYMEQLYLGYGDAFLYNFDKVGGRLIGKDKTVGSIYMAPDGVIQYAYPASVKEATIGFNLLEDPEQSEKAKLAIETKEVTLAGPHDLVEGGQGFIIRDPIYIDDEFDSLSIIVLDWDAFSNKIIDRLSTKGNLYNFAIWKNDAHARTDEYGYILKNCNKNVDRRVSITIDVPSDTWYLAVEPKGGFSPFRHLKLELIVSGCIILVIVGFIYARLKSSEKYLYTIEYDELTGLINKYTFYRRAKKMLAEHPNDEYDICIADIQNFKLVNSIYGEEMGDRVLKSIAEIYQKNVKEGICARFGGDKFVGFEKASAERKYEWLLKLNDEIIKNLPIPNLTIKYGVYQNVDKSLSVATICDRALIALKSIKHNYEKMYANFDGPISMKQLKIQVYENEFVKGIDKNEFVVWYQPKFDANTERLVGAEALVRWIKQDGTVISPGEFVPVFEEDGLIVKLDEYVFTKACENMKFWREKGYKLVPISINLSRASLQHEGLVTRYREIASNIGIPTECVPIELTESASLHSIQIKDFTIDLKSAGFSLYMDDFGSGFSSLASLNILPFDLIKIDKSLIDIIDDDGGEEIVRHIIEIAHSKNMQVVAEGVENKKQLEVLRNINCDVIQGYYYSAPVPGEKFEKFLEKLDS